MSIKQHENMVCLYIFTHNITGLKYFGKTTRYFTIKDLLKYKGSGKYWNSHLKVHGKDLSVEIYGIFHKGIVKEIALNFSKDNNIVKSLNENGKKVWANEKEENGLDGNVEGNSHTNETREKMSIAKIGSKHTEETRKKMSNKIFTEETRNKISEAHLNQSDETRKKRSKAQIGRKHTKETKNKIRSWNEGRKYSEESKKKMSEAQKNMKSSTCPHCKKSSTSKGMMMRWHFDNCKNKKEIE